MAVKSFITLATEHAINGKLWDHILILLQLKTPRTWGSIHKTSNVNLGASYLNKANLKCLFSLWIRHPIQNIDHKTFVICFAAGAVLKSAIFS